MKKIFLAIILFFFCACVDETNKSKYDFNLQGPNNKMYSLKDFKGKNLLIYFGYTLCADVCPTSMQIASQALKELNKDDVLIIFISLDPKRDTADDATEFIQYFYPNSIALVPNDDKEVGKITEKYGAKYGYIYQKNINDGKGYNEKQNEKIKIEKFYKNNDNDYTVAHSSSFYIINAKWDYVGEITNLTLSNVKKKITEFLNKN